MTLIDFLESDKTDALVMYDGFSISLKKIETGYRIDNNTLTIYKRGWSKIQIIERFGDRKRFITIIKLCDRINQFENVLYSVFEDNIKKDDVLLSTIDYLTNHSHPIRELGYRPHEPDFPFTMNIELLESIIHYYQEFNNKMKKLFRYQKVNEFVKYVEIKNKRKQDYLEILKKEYGHLDSYLGKLIDGCDYNYLFYIKFMPLIEKCLKELNYLPNEYIKIY